MEAKLKKVMELETLISQSTSPTILRPDLRKFRDISAIVSNVPGIEKDFIKIIKSKLKNALNPRSLLLILELIEYTTCTCDSALHAEYNDKGFLQVFNTIFNSKNLREEIQLKLLSIVQLWFFMFHADTAVYPNFAWYYNAIKDRGVAFPQFQKSPYLSMNINQIEDKSFAENSRTSQINPERTQNQEVSNVEETEHQSNLSMRMKGSARKLYKDLCDLYENIQLSNEMIDQKNIEVADDIILVIKPLEKRLFALPDKLLEANEEFLYKFCLALIEDTGVTIDRYSRLSNNQPVPKFHFKSKHVLKEYNLLSPTDGTPIQIEKNVHSAKSQNQNRELETSSIDPFSRVDNQFYMKESISEIHLYNDYDDDTMKDSMFNDYEFQQFDEDEPNKSPNYKPAPNNQFNPPMSALNPNMQMNFNKNNRPNIPVNNNNNGRMNQNIEMESNNPQAYPPVQINPRGSNNPNMPPGTFAQSIPITKSSLIDPPQPRTSQQSNSSNKFMNSFGFEYNQPPLSNGSDNQLGSGGISQEFKQVQDDIDLLSFDVPSQPKRQPAQGVPKKTPSLNDDLLLTFDNELVVKNQPQSKTMENIDIDFTRFNQSTPPHQNPYQYNQSQQPSMMQQQSNYSIGQQFNQQRYQSQPPQNFGQPIFTNSMPQQTNQMPMHPNQTNPFGFQSPTPQPSDPYQHLNVQNFKPLDCFDYSLPQNVQQSMKNDGGMANDPFASLPDPHQFAYSRQQAK